MFISSSYVPCRSCFFFSSGYDHVLLYGYLVPRLFELGYRPRVERRGNKITCLSTRCGIAFRDITKLLAPSTNLRKFGQLFGLEQAKAHFPFSLLTSTASLDISELPADANDPAWTSVITGSRPIRQEDVDEARTLFARAGCRNLGDYLAAYLRLDVDILFRAGQAWRRKLRALIDLDFVEASKFTISSLSYAAGLKNQEARLRIASFFPNNSQIYRLLRRGMRG